MVAVWLAVIQYSGIPVSTTNCVYHFEGMSTAHELDSKCFPQAWWLPVGFPVNRNKTSIGVRTGPCGLLQKGSLNAFPFVLKREITQATGL